MKNLLIVSILLLFAWQSVSAQLQPEHKLIFVEEKDEFLSNMKKAIQELEKEESVQKKVPKLDLTGIDIPTSPAEFIQIWCNPPISQGMTGGCWCFSATSFFESEIYRLTKQKVKLSEMFTIYWEYVEKARYFIQQRGNSNFSKGSQPNAVIRLWKKYGIVPAEAYNPRHEKLKFYEHSKMFNEMNTYLEALKQNNAWNETVALDTIKSILNRYMGIPPSTIKIDNRELTPQQYLTEVLQLNLDNYIDVMSLKEKPFYQRVEYEVPDNWWHCQDYLNLPLSEFMQIIKIALRRGYSVCICGDISEPGYITGAGVALIPNFDLPAEYINDDARQFRFSTEQTTDDHAVHLVGYLEKNGKTWYLIKDSGSQAQNNKFPGFFFFNEDFVKLKMMNLLVHKDIVAEIQKF
ncbi:MAG: peptidase C1 [Candidatus Sumerlaeia bacterium]|nr:peptidase C1 [Candidatus Sumerlaeia bacterium]